MSTTAARDKVDNFSALTEPEADVVAKNIVWALLKTGQWSATIQNGQARMKLLRGDRRGQNKNDNMVGKK